MLNQKEVRRQLSIGATKTRIIKAAKYKCEFCKEGDAQEIHHIKAVAKAGQNDDDNLIALCGTCHNHVRDLKINDKKLKECVDNRTDTHKDWIKNILDDMRNKTENINNEVVTKVVIKSNNDFVPEPNGVHPKINTIKMQVCKGLLEGKGVIQLSKMIYPDREQGRSTYHLIYRQVQEVEKDGLIRVMQRPTSESDYTDIKIEETTDGVFGLKKTNKIVTNENLNMREQAIYAVCNEGLSFEQAAIKYDHQGDGERDGRQKVGNLVKRHIKLSIDKGTVIDNGNDTYSRV